MELILKTALVGVLATVFMDLAGILRGRLFGTKGLNYAFLGRWFAWSRRGRVLHPKIAETPAIAGERALGWGFHYASGVALALGLTGIAPHWVSDAPVLLILSYGVGSVVLPFAILQPGMGLGFAARHAPDPWARRRGSVVTHLSFAVGLWLGAVLVG